MSAERRRIASRSAATSAGGAPRKPRSSFDAAHLARSCRRRRRRSADGCGRRRRRGASTSVPPAPKATTWPKVGSSRRAEHHLDAAGDHLLHERAGHRVAEARLHFDDRPRAPRARPAVRGVRRRASVLCSSFGPMRLQRDGEADAHRGFDGFVGVVTRLGRRGAAMPRGVQQAIDVERIEPAAAARRACGRRWCAALVASTSSNVGTLPIGRRAPLGVRRRRAPARRRRARGTANDGTGASGAARRCALMNVARMVLPPARVAASRIAARRPRRIGRQHGDVDDDARRRRSDRRGAARACARTAPASPRRSCRPDCRRSPRPAGTTRSARRRLVAERRERQAVRLARVGGEDAGTAGVGDDGRRGARAAAADWPAATATSNSSSSVSVRMTPAWRKRSRDDGVARAPARRCATTRRARPRPSGRPSPPRSASCVPTRRAISPNLRGLPKLSRYSRITSVLRILGPVLNEVVAGDVGLVADGDERREADAERARVVEDGQAEGAALARHGHVAGRRKDRRERRVHAHGGIGVDHAHAVRADHAHAGGADLLQQRAARASRPSAPVSREAGGDDDDARARPWRRSRRRRASTCAAGTAMMARSTGPSMSRSDGIRGHAVDLRRVRIDDVQRAGESGVAQVAHDLVAELPAACGWRRRRRSIAARRSASSTRTPPSASAARRDVVRRLRSVAIGNET